MSLEVGSLLYIFKETRPDIKCITIVISRFMNDPTVENFNADKHVLRCLQHTKSLRLFFSSSSNSTIVGETDAYWSGDVNDRQSTIGHYFKLEDSGVLSVGKSRSNQQCRSHLVRKNTRV